MSSDKGSIKGSNQASANKESVNLDFLRATAVLFVLVDHLLAYHYPATPAMEAFRKIGKLGVQFFFVHTCLVLMMSMERHEAKRGPRNLFAIFMTRRGFRVYPLSTLIIFAIYLFGLPSWGVHYHHMAAIQITPKMLLANILLVQNVLFIDSVLLPLWSLPFEMQMYLFLPAIYRLVKRVYSWPAILGLWVAAMVIAHIPYPIERISIIVYYAPCFVPGIVAYRLMKRYDRTWPFWLLPVTLLAVAGTTWWGAAHGYKVHYNTWAGFSCLVVGLTLPFFRELQNAWVARGSNLIARYSYGIYLAHVFCIWVAFEKGARLPAALQWVVFAVLIAAVPALLYHTVEAPMIRVGNKVAGRLFPPRPAPPTDTDVQREAVTVP